MNESPSELPPEKQPFSARRGKSKPLTQQKGLTPALRTTLIDWANGKINLYGELNAKVIRRIVLRLQLPMDLTHLPSTYLEIMSKLERDDDFLLDVVDLLVDPYSAEALSEIFDDASAEWRVNESEDGLEQITDPRIYAAFQDITSSSSDSSQSLDKAWACAFSRDPDPTQAWHYAVKAVESELIQIVSPNDTTATLTKALGQLRNNLDLWGTKLSDSQKASGQARFLALFNFFGYEPNRHGGSKETTELEEAQMIVLHAIIIVQALRQDIISMRNSQE